MLNNQVFIGTSGFSLQNFYPEGIKSDQKLNFYSKKFLTVEINSTFYHIPRKTTIQKWLVNSHPDFRFAFKVYKGFTHFKEGGFDKTKLRDWFRIFDSFKNSKAKHLMLFQFPASFVFSEEKLNNLLSDLPESFLFAFEFRHNSWFTNFVYQRLGDGNHTLVLSDGLVDKEGNQKWPKYDLDAAFSYIRFHGSSKLYYSSYTRDQLREYSQLIKQKTGSQKDVYCYFNNDAAGYAAQNANTLIKLVNKDV